MSVRGERGREVEGKGGEEGGGGSPAVRSVRWFHPLTLIVCVCWSGSVL